MAQAARKIAEAAAPEIDAEITEIIRAATSALFMVTNLLTKHFGFEEDWKNVTEMYVEWGRH